MANRSDYSTLVISFLLLRAIAFTAYWIVTSVTPGGDPEAGVPWFILAAVVAVAVGVLAYVRPGRRRSPR